MDNSEIVSLAMNTILQVRQEAGDDPGIWTWQRINARLPENTCTEANTLAHALNEHMHNPLYETKVRQRSINGDVMVRHGFYEIINNKYKKTEKLLQFEALWKV